MKNSPEILRKVRSSLNQLITAKDKDPTSYLPGEKEELQSNHTRVLYALVCEQLDRIDSTFDHLAQDQASFSTQLKTILSRRWQHIVHGPLCYTKNKSHPLNHVYFDLANYLDPTKVNSLLMDFVQQTDTRNNDFDSLKIGEFILSDTGEEFITIDAIIEQACERIIHHEKNIFVRINLRKVQTYLSPRELNRLGAVVEVLKAAQQWYLMNDRADPETAIKASRLIEWVKKRLPGGDVLVPPTTVFSARINRSTSQLNPDLMYDANNWIVSLINYPQTNSETSTKLLVEGIQEGKRFVGTYYPIASAQSTYSCLIPQFLQNTAGLFTQIKVFETQGRAQIPSNSTSREELLEWQPDAALAELREHLVHSESASCAVVKQLIADIKKDERKTHFANWTVLATQTDQLVKASNRYSLFIPYERFGAHYILGSGAHNCLTWCQEKLNKLGFAPEFSQICDDKRLRK